jgi:hypothetical protein
MVILKKDHPDKWKKKNKLGGLTATSKVEMDELIEKFIINTFGTDIMKVHNETDAKLMINSMIMIVFSHRYNKGDRFIKESEENCIDFSKVRDVMYKYSKKAQDRYFSYPIEAFFFAAFSLSDEGINFLKSKPDNQGDEIKLLRLKADLSDLKN